MLGGDVSCRTVPIPVHCRDGFNEAYYGRPEQLRQIIPHYSPAPNKDGLYAGPGHFPSAVYLQRTDVA